MNFLVQNIKYNSNSLLIPFKTLWENKLHPSAYYTFIYGITPWITLESFHFIWLWNVYLVNKKQINGLCRKGDWHLGFTTLYGQLTFKSVSERNTKRDRKKETKTSLRLNFLRVDCLITFFLTSSSVPCTNWKFRKNYLRFSLRNHRI